MSRDKRESTLWELSMISDTIRSNTIQPIINNRPELNSNTKPKAMVWVE